MKLICVVTFVVISLVPASLLAAAVNLTLEKNIAYQQGQFGALYAHCASAEEQTVIGGSLAAWRTEVFRGYKGSASEHAELEKSFDSAVVDVVRDKSSCQDWLKQATVTWHSIVYLSRYGMARDRKS